MGFRPDILVTSNDQPPFALVVEAKIRLPDLEATESEIKRYMVGMQCPIGILITPERMWLYSDSYKARTPDSIVRVGEYDVTPLWQDSPPREPLRFEAFVQDQLERLPTMGINSLPSGLREAVREYIIPAVVAGEVRAAHPRAS